MCLKLPGGKNLFSHERRILSFTTWSIYRSLVTDTGNRATQLQHSYNTVTTLLQHPQSTFSHPPISIYQRVCYTRKLASLTNRFPCYSLRCAYQAIVHFLKLAGLSFFFIKPIFNSTIRLRLLVLLAFLCRYVFMLIPLCLCVFCVWTSVHCA